jgi:hypothetical protein
MGQRRRLAKCSGVTPEKWAGDRRLRVPRSRAAQRGELMSESRCPTCVAPRVHLHPNLTMHFAQLERSRPARESEMPVVAPRVPSELAFAANHDAALTAGD